MSNECSLTPKPNRPRWVLGAAAMVVLLFGIVRMVQLSRPGPAASAPLHVYYYDLGSGKLFDAVRSPTPIDSPVGGPAMGVRAAVFTCGACRPGQWRIDYILSVSDESLLTIDKANRTITDDKERARVIDQAVSAGAIVAEPPRESGAAINWLSVNSEEGVALMTRSSVMCDRIPGRECFP